MQSSHLLVKRRIISQHPCELEDGGYETTIYTCCCNADQGIYYYTCYDNHQITAWTGKINRPEGQLLPYRDYTALDQVLPRICSEEEKDNIAQFELIPWMLSQCLDVKEARSLLKKINLCSAIVPFALKCNG